MKKFLLTLLALLVVTVQVSAAKNPVRIARLPIILQSAQPDTDTCAELELKLARATHIPLNGTLQVAEYLSPAESAQTLNEIWQSIRSQNKKAKIQEAMRPLAEKLDADLIVCPILRRYTQNVAVANDETFISSNVSAELIIYDRRTDEIVDKKTSRMYHDTMSGFGTASFLAKECFDRLIEQTKIRQIIHAVGR